YRGRSKTGEIGRATRSLNDGNVALYTVDARGLVPAFVGTPGKPIATTLSMVQSTQDILQSVSEQTGGRAFLNTNDIQAAIRRAVDDGRMTYVLGYYPTDDRWDGRFHRIVVKVNRSGLELRHRQGYFAVATEKQANSQRSAALNAAVLSPINASALGMTLRIDPVTGTSAEYRLSVRVQPGALALERRGSESHGAVDLIVAQVRADGAEGRSLDQRLDIAVSDERLPHLLREGMSVDHTFTLVPSAVRLRVVVRDVRTGAIGAIGVSRQQLQAIAR
ncbi:MAG TPA: VWA domain-containing protein, partial [Vicinamibacterales bacterium]|nr:VWA domain-containing protein [Vicinamibacterales bacterium]